MRFFLYLKGCVIFNIAVAFAKFLFSYDWLVFVSVVPVNFSSDDNAFVSRTTVSKIKTYSHNRVNEAIVSNFLCFSLLLFNFYLPTCFAHFFILSHKKLLDKNNICFINIFCCYSYSFLSYIFSEYILVLLVFFLLLFSKARNILLVFFKFFFLLRYLH